jgi:hypothetical protein
MFAEPSMIDGILTVDVASEGGHVVDSQQNYDPVTGTRLSSVDGFLLAGFDNESFFVAAYSGTGTIIDGAYVAARISRNAIFSGRSLWTWDYRPDPTLHEHAANIQDQMANPVLVGKGFVLLGMGLDTYRYTTTLEPSKQRPLRLHGLGTPIRILSDGALFVDEEGLTRIGMAGLTVYKKRVAEFHLPSTQFFQARMSPAFDEPIVIVGDIVLAADGDRGLVAYDIQLRKALRYAIPCDVISGASVRRDHIVLACARVGAAADHGVTIATVVFPR